MTDTITVAGITDPTTSMTDEVRQLRDELLLAARFLGAVTNDDDAMQAASTMGDIRTLTKRVELSRNEVKAPVIALGKSIDALAAELTAELEAESKRLGRLVGTYQEEKRRQHERAQREAWQKEQDIITAARHAAAAAEAAERASGAPAPALDQPTAAEVVEQKAFEEVAVVRAAVKAVAPQSFGTSTRKVIQYEITDASALQAAWPAMFTLTPNVAAIKAILKSQPKLEAPGLRHWVETVSNINGRTAQ